MQKLYATLPPTCLFIASYNQTNLTAWLSEPASSTDTMKNYRDHIMWGVQGSMMLLKHGEARRARPHFLGEIKKSARWSLSEKLKNELILEPKKPVSKFMIWTQGSENPAQQGHKTWFEVQRTDYLKRWPK